MGKIYLCTGSLFPCVMSFRLMPSGSLLIISPSLEDEGYFECIVNDEVGEERRVIEVILQGKAN